MKKELEEYIDKHWESWVEEDCPNSDTVYESILEDIQNSDSYEKTLPLWKLGVEISENIETFKKELREMYEEDCDCKSMYFINCVDSSPTDYYKEPKMVDSNCCTDICGKKHLFTYVSRNEVEVYDEGRRQFANKCNRKRMTDYEFTNGYTIIKKEA